MRTPSSVGYADSLPMAAALGATIRHSKHVTDMFCPKGGEAFTSLPLEGKVSDEA